MAFGHELGHAVIDPGDENDTDDTDSEWEALHALHCQCQAKEGKVLSLHIKYLSIDTLHRYLQYSLPIQMSAHTLPPCLHLHWAQHLRPTIL